MKTRTNASFTVEMAVIMPVVLYTILTLIFLSYNLHDRCKIQAAADKALHKASIYMKHKSDLAAGEIKYENINDRGILYLITGITQDEQNEIEEFLYRELESGLLCTNITYVGVKTSIFNAELEISGRSRLPATHFMGFLKRDINVRAEGPVHDPAEAIRISEVILETGEKIKGINKLIEKIRDSVP